MEMSVESYKNKRVLMFFSDYRVVTVLWMLSVGLAYLNIILFEADSSPAMGMPYPIEIGIQMGGGL